MAFRPKRKFLASREREILFHQFYDSIEENQEQFLEHAFVGNEGNNSKFVQNSDSEVQAYDNNEERSDAADDTETFDIDNIVIGKQEELPRKQKFNNLDEVLDESNHVIYQRNQTLAFLTQMGGKIWQ